MVTSFDITNKNLIDFSDMLGDHKPMPVSNIQQYNFSNVDGTVLGEYTAEQKEILNKDQAAIAKLQQDIIEWDRQISVHLGSANFHQNKYDSYCPTIKNYSERKNCSEFEIAARDQAYSNRASVIAQKELTLQNLAKAQQKYQQDVAVFQQQIKNQQDAAKSATEDAIAINKSNPSLLIAENKQKTNKSIAFVAIGAVALITIIYFKTR